LLHQFHRFIFSSGLCPVIRSHGAGFFSRRGVSSIF